MRDACPREVDTAAGLSAERHAAASPDERRERSTMAGVHGKPIRCNARASSVPVTTAATYAGSWTRARSASVTGAGSRSIAAATVATRCRSSAYLRMGKRCAGGSGSTK
jgi:hypothetical protein